MRNLAAALAPFVHTLQLDAQNCSVDIVEAAVVADAVVGTFHRAVVAQLADLGGKLFIIGGHGAAVAKASQVLLDDEAQANGIAELADGKVIAPCANALGAFFHDKEVVRFGDARDLWHVCGEAVQVRRHNGASVRRDCGFDLGDINITSLGIAVHEYGCGAGQPDGFRGGEKSVGCGDVSSPAPRPSARKTSHSASVPELTPTVSFVFM